MKKISFLIFYLVFGVCGITGCVTPPEVKGVSTKHTNNLIALEEAAKNYKNDLGGYYDGLIALQRKAYISNKVKGEVEVIATAQAESLRTLTEGASEDFIKAGEKISAAFPFWGKNYHLWMHTAQGENLEEKRKWFQKMAEESPADQSTIYKKQAERTTDDLTYVSVALSLEQQKKNLIEQLNLLIVQINSMQLFHSKVDEFLSIDATIDGKKIAEAAEAGSKAELSGL